MDSHKIVGENIFEIPKYCSVLTLEVTMEGTCLECTFPLRESECEFYGPEVTTLMHAAFNGQKQCVNDLIQAGADVNIEDNNSSTALVWAVAGDQFQAGAKLKKYKEEEAFEKSNSEGSTSVYHDKSGTAVKMLQQGSRSIDHNGCARLLFEAGAEVNLVHNGEKATALAKSSFYGNYRCVEFLLHAGADVNATTEDGITILMAAVVNTDENCENVIEYARGLYVKEYHRHDKCVELILQAGADMNAKDKTGRTALMAAIANGPLCPDILIKAGADVNTVDSSGNTALIYAAEEVQNECIDLLIHAGADVNITCNSGFTALHHLAGANSLHGVKQILLSGAHVNMLNADGHNALHFAILGKMLIVTGKFCYCYSPLEICLKQPISPILSIGIYQFLNIYCLKT